MPASPPTSPYLGLPRSATDTGGVVAQLNGIVDGIDAKFAPWTTYTPVWSQSNGTVLAIGNGVLTGRYRQLGKTVHWMVTWERGSTTNAGTTGQKYIWSLPPVTPRVWNQHGGECSMVRDNNWYGGTVFPVSITAVGAIIGDLGRVENLVPNVVHAVGDWITLTGTYEAA